MSNQDIKQEPILVNNEKHTRSCNNIQDLSSLNLDLSATQSLTCRLRPGLIFQSYKLRYSRHNCDGSIVFRCTNKYCKYSLRTNNQVTQAVCSSFEHNHDAPEIKDTKPYLKLTDSVDTKADYLKKLEKSKLKATKRSRSHLHQQLVSADFTDFMKNCLDSTVQPPKRFKIAATLSSSSQSVLGIPVESYVSKGNNECSFTAEQTSDSKSKLWGGRFASGATADPIMKKFNDSIRYDQRMWQQDILGSIAYAAALGDSEIITPDEVAQLVEGLNQISLEWLENQFVIEDNDEDIHTANERRLKELVGEVGAKLHTGRSRNDQVATDIRLWLLEFSHTLEFRMRQFITVLVNRAADETDILMPGYTHLQRAQPIRWSHWLLSYAAMVKRDVERLLDCRKRISVCPLGSGALAGNPFNVDRQKVADELGFDDITLNSLDAVSDRDFISEFLSVATIVGSHLSRLAEDLILYSTKEFGFVSLSETYSTGSSLMPQKKNADSLELIRGKVGRIFGHSAGLMMVQKALPSTFNKDLQEDKEALFDSCDTILAIVDISSKVVATLSIHSEKCCSALSPDMLATDLAYYLVRKGVAFRNAHELSGKCVSLAESQQKSLNELSVEDFKSVNSLFGEDILHIFNYSTSVEQYEAAGGTALKSVLNQIEILRSWLNDEDVENK